MDETDFYPEILFPHDPRYTPFPAPTQDICDGPVFTICVNTHWWAHISGMIARLQYRDAWTGSDDEIDRAIDSITKILNVGRPTMSCGCGCNEPNRTRVTPDGKYEVSYDGGTTWQDGSDTDPRYTAPQLPPIAGDDSEANKCNAANNVLLQFQDGIETFEGYFDTTGTVIEFVVAVATAIAAFIFAPAAVPIIVTIIFSLFKAIWDGGKEAYVAAFTSTVWDDLLCILYCHCQDDGTYLESDVDAILSDISSHFGSIARDAFTALMHGVRAPGLNQMAKIGSGGSGDCATCNCDGCKSGWQAGYNYASVFYPFGSIDSEGDDWIIVNSQDRGDGQHEIRITQPATGHHECSVTWELIPSDYVISFKTYQHEPNYPGYDNAIADPLMPSPRNANYMSFLGGIDAPFQIKFTFAPPL